MPTSKQNHEFKMKYINMPTGYQDSRQIVECSRTFYKNLSLQERNKATANPQLPNERFHGKI